MIYFTAYIKPHGKQRARQTRINGKARSYTPTETVKFEREIAMAYRRAVKRAKFAKYAPLGINVYLYMPIPKSVSKREYERLNGEWQTKKPDGSNVLKSVEDALNKLAYEDDAQLSAIAVFKIYSDTPRVEVEIYELASRKGVEE